MLVVGRTGHWAGVTVYLAWCGAEVPPDLPGPWREVRRAAEGLVLVESDDTLSRVFHELKWSLPADTPLVVTALATRPKLRGLAGGTQSWLRDRLPAP